MRLRLPRSSIAALCASAALLLLGIPPASRAQILVAVDDEYGIPFGQSLVVDPFGVLDNDLLDGESAGENGAAAELVADASHGTLALAADGSFTYSPGATFDGVDAFVYRAVFGAAADTATVALSACSGGPQLFDCWNETAFLAKAAEAGLFAFGEGFEDDAVWGGVRSPSTAASVVSQGVAWRSNHPATNDITTGSGAARTGLWGIYDPDHGYATGTPTECDVDVPPPHCLFHDGVTGIREPGESGLHGVGGYFHGTFGANVAVSLDGGAPFGGGQIAGGYRFVGVIDTAPAGFGQFEFRELDGKIGQALLVFADDFTLLTDSPTAAGERADATSAALLAGAVPNPSDGRTALRFALPAGAEATLSIYDLGGRLVRELARGVRGDGWHSATWDGRDRAGHDVATGVYFGRLVVRGEGREDVSMRKLVVTR